MVLPLPGGPHRITDIGASPVDQLPQRRAGRRAGAPARPARPGSAGASAPRGARRRRRRRIRRGARVSAAARWVHLKQSRPRPQTRTCLRCERAWSDGHGESGPRCFAGRGRVAARPWRGGSGRSSAMVDAGTAGRVDAVPARDPDAEFVAGQRLGAGDVEHPGVVGRRPGATRAAARSSTAIGQRISSVNSAPRGARSARSRQVRSCRDSSRSSPRDDQRGADDRRGRVDGGDGLLGGGLRGAVVEDRRRRLVLRVRVRHVRRTTASEETCTRRAPTERAATATLAAPAATTGQRSSACAPLLHEGGGGVDAPSPAVPTANNAAARPGP